MTKPLEQCRNAIETAAKNVRQEEYEAGINIIDKGGGSRQMFTCTVCGAIWTADRRAYKIDTVYDLDLHTTMISCRCPTCSKIVTKVYGYSSVADIF